jgi:hypothetical protein
VRYQGCRFKTSHNSAPILSWPIFSTSRILYNFICTFLWYFTQIMHLSWKYRKMHSNSCNFNRGNINFITIIRLIIVIRVLVLKLLITPPLSCPIFSNFHMLCTFICTFLWYFIQIMHLSWKYRKTHSNSCNFRRGNINVITI